MSPLASPFAYLVDRAIERAYVQAYTAGAWATLHALRPAEVTAAFREGRGPFAAHLSTEPTGVATWTGLAGIASQIGASSGTVQMPRYPDT
jgi:hypothetical protein